MNQVNKLVNKIKDDEIKKDEDVVIDNNNESSNLNEDNIDEYLENVELDEHSRDLIDKYLEKKYKK